MRNIKKGYLLVFSTAVISGFAIFINRFGVKVLNPSLFTFLKALTVSVLLGGVLLAMKDWKLLKKIDKKQWFLLMLIGLIGGSIPFLLFFKGLSLTTSTNGAFLHKTMFVYVTLLAVLFLKEKINKKFLLGGFLLLLGNLFFLRRMSFSLGYGELLIISATLFWAVENIISKYVLKELPGRIVAWSRMSFGALFIFIFLLFTGQAPMLSQITLVQFGWVMVTAVILFGYVITWYSGLVEVPISKAIVILTLGSPITMLLSFIWTGQITYQAILAGVLVIFGVILILGLKETWYFIKKAKCIYVRA